MLPSLVRSACVVCVWVGGGEGGGGRYTEVDWTGLTKSQKFVNKLPD